MFCPVCECEFQSGIVHCSDCGADLVVRLPEETIEGSAGDPAGVDRDGIPGIDLNDAAEREHLVVATFDNRLEADLARTALASAGIPYWIEGGELGQYGPLTAFSGGVPILVRAQDAEDARAILEAKPEKEESEEDIAEDID